MSNCLSDISASGIQSCTYTHTPRPAPFTMSPIHPVIRWQKPAFFLPLTSHILNNYLFFLNIFIIYLFIHSINIHQIYLCARHRLYCSPSQWRHLPAHNKNGLLTLLSSSFSPLCIQGILNINPVTALTCSKPFSGIHCPQNEGGTPWHGLSSPHDQASISAHLY